jgi:hypothetical protein
MSTQLPYRLIAATLSTLLVLGVVLPVVQSVCAAPMHGPMHHDGPSHTSDEMKRTHRSAATHSVVMHDARAEAHAMDHGTRMDHRAGMDHRTGMDHSTGDDSDHGSATPCESMPAPCTDGCMSCCMVETDSATWTTIRVVDGAFSTDVPRRFDTVSLLAPRTDRPQRPGPAHHRSEPLPVRLHVWTATFLT